MRTMAPHAGSWCAATSRSQSASTSSSSCTTESGGSPPSLAEIVIEPRVGWNRSPTSRAAAISADHRSPPPRGRHVQVVGAGGAAAQGQLGQRPPRRTGTPPPRPGPAHSGYRPDSHSNRVPLTVGAYDLVRFWYMWWWVLTRPGVTRQPAASSVSPRGGPGSPAPPTALISPPVTATQPPASSRCSASQVATSLAPVTSRSAAGSGGHHWCSGSPSGAPARDTAPSISPYGRSAAKNTVAGVVQAERGQVHQEVVLVGQRQAHLADLGAGGQHGLAHRVQGLLEGQAVGDGERLRQRRPRAAEATRPSRRLVAAIRQRRGPRSPGSGRPWAPASCTGRRRKPRNSEPVDFSSTRSVTPATTSVPPSPCARTLVTRVPACRSNECGCGRAADRRCAASRTPRCAPGPGPPARIRRSAWPAAAPNSSTGRDPELPAKRVHGVLLRVGGEHAGVVAGQVRVGQVAPARVTVTLRSVISCRGVAAVHVQQPDLGLAVLGPGQHHRGVSGTWASSLGRWSTRTATAAAGRGSARRARP